MTKYVLQDKNIQYKGGPGSIIAGTILGVEYPIEYNDISVAIFMAKVIGKSFSNMEVIAIEWREPDVEYPMTEQMIQDLLDKHYMLQIDQNGQGVTICVYSNGSRYDGNFAGKTLDKCLENTWKDIVYDRR